MEVFIEITDTGAVATVAEIIDNHTDVANMTLVIFVGLFNSFGDRLKVVSVQHALSGFPIPDTPEQWEIVKPTILAMQQKTV